MTVKIREVTQLISARRVKRSSDGFAHESRTATQHGGLLNDPANRAETTTQNTITAESTQGGRV
jgi:hypothetical protein